MFFDVALVIAIIAYYLTFFNSLSGVPLNEFIFRIFVFIILVAILIYRLATFNNRRNKADMKRREKNVEKLEKERQKRIEAFNLTVEKGEYEFPAKEFYDHCKEKRIDVIGDDDYSYAKAKQIAEEFLNRRNINRKHWEKFTGKDMLNAYLTKGKEIAEKEEEERILQQKEIRDVVGTQEENTFINRAYSLHSVYGNQKRVKMLKSLEFDCYEERIKLQKGKEAMEKLSYIMYSSQQKEVSWGLMGGIAEGLAGPAAGIAAAMDTMERNARIRENNLAIQEMSVDMLKGVPKLSGDIESLAEEERSINKLAKEAAEKIVLDKYSSKEIFENMKIGRTKIKRTGTGVLDISVNVSIKKKFDLNVPKNVIMVVDGVLTGNVFYGDEFVDEVYIPLPLYGIESNMTSVITLEGMVARSAEYPGEYTVEFDEDEQNLWIMEA